MTHIEIKKQLYEMALLTTGNILEHEIALAATETDDPIQHLREMYRNNGLKYDLGDEFFEAYLAEILSIIGESDLKVRWLMNSGNYMIELSFLAYQLTLEKMMVQFGLLSTKQTFFARYDILDLHVDMEKKNVRYGISDIVIQGDREPSKYVKVRDEQGKILTSAEVYFIEEETSE